jgi:hypothetical protein
MVIRCAWLAVLIVASGCATRLPLSRPARTMPADALVTHRAMLDLRGRQFTFNAYLSQNAAGARRLVLMETFGNVIGDVLIQPDGSVHVIRSSPAIKPVWLRRYVARDVQCLYGEPPPRGCRVTEVAPNHFVVRRWFYSLSLQIVDVKPGAQSPSLFEAPVP